MFTGIIRHLGTITRSKTEEASTVHLWIASLLAREVREGDSVAVNGVCLTVLDVRGDALHFRLMAETLSKTNLGTLPVLTKVNLERPLLPTERLDGHFVMGHVDGVVTLSHIQDVGGDKVMTFTLPPSLAPYLIPKGSIAIDGISLTVVTVTDTTFTVSLMPYTLEHTNLGNVTLGYQANVEVDMIGKYVVRSAAHWHRH